MHTKITRGHNNFRNYKKQQHANHCHASLTRGRGWRASLRGWGRKGRLGRGGHNGLLSRIAAPIAAPITTPAIGVTTTTTTTHTHTAIATGRTTSTGIGREYDLIHC